MLRFREGFDRNAMTWHGPADPFPCACSVCGRTMDEREDSLRWMHGRRFAVLCAKCCDDWLVTSPRPQR